MKALQAHGKLLISAEYMVLHGSEALAIPLIKGQSLQRIQSEDSTRFTWDAYYEGAPWFSVHFNPSTLDIVDTTDRKRAEHLGRLLRACIVLNPLFETELFTRDVITRLDFSPAWGFGSSSTLTALMAQWADLNALDLHFMISEGSGYDVACAMAGTSIVYSLQNDEPSYRSVPFNPPFSEQLYFVWLGSKQPTASHLREMAGKFTPDDKAIHHFSTITEGMLKSLRLSDFQVLMEEHEALVSELIGLEQVSEIRFPGLQGSVKSLGAWGGDFVMIASEQNPEALFSYLDKLGFNTRFRYKDLVYEA